MNRILSLAVVALLAGCGDPALSEGGGDAGPTGSPDASAPSGCEGKNLEIASISPASGFNLGGHAITVRGGCFDAATKLAVVREGRTVELTDVLTADDATLTATVPAGLEVGGWSLKAQRGASSATKEGAWSAVSEIVASASAQKIYVANLSASGEASLVKVVEPSGLTDVFKHVAVGREGLTVFFGQPDGVYSCSILACGAPRKVSALEAGHERANRLAVSAGGKVVFEAQVTGGGSLKNDLFLAADGSGNATKIFDFATTDVRVDGDVQDTFAVSRPTFAPDGSRIAFLWEGFCSGDPDFCTYELYAAILSMKPDGSDLKVEWWGDGADTVDDVQWTHDGNLTFSTWSSLDETTQLWVLRRSDKKELKVNEPANSSWTDVGHYVWSPLEAAILVRPVQTSDMVRHALTSSTSSYQAAVGVAVTVDDPSNPGSPLRVWENVAWFGWRP